MYMNTVRAKQQLPMDLHGRHEKDVSCCDEAAPTVADVTFKPIICRLDQPEY